MDDEVFTGFWVMVSFAIICVAFIKAFNSSF